MFPTARYLPKRRDGKGPHYFNTKYWHGDRWYLGHFPSRHTRRRAEERLGGPVVVGEASPYYLYHPLAAERAARLVPNAKLLLFLRDPVERTHSMWKEQVRNGVEKLGFAEALAAETERTAGEAEKILADPSYYSFPHEFQSYRAQSEYPRALARWFELFPREQFLIFTTEEYSADAGRVCNEVFQFLGLPPQPQEEAPVLNSAKNAPMAPELRAQLEAHFAPLNAELEQMLGRELPWGRQPVG
jgi:hypothetical protein